ncbi:diphthamide biosynthesis enzyme Dph2 [Natrinema halophilum]|uniref:2-(3-amino-3-carboxypropyl)histidine synthase n=1 Tax=Natrinema halophilum TaxID=1699371 RepID=A0A7D5H0P7_9EURY|nr:diphthamide biosynthesis enzyme Dph2 [Natrinema halophilum]QLG47691.1 diphthamide biosynthesis enzyme Dph2 [Natrinema halophilum]
MSQDSEYSEGDLRNTGMRLKHDREWDYELEEIVDAIEQRDATKVGLQFPEGLKRRGPAVADDLRELTDDDVTFMLSGQPCYGACDLDTYLMKRTDVFVHFGHSPMKDTDKVIYVPLFSNVEITPIMEEALDTLEPPEETDGVGLVTTAQHMNRYDEMTEFLEDRGYDVHSRRGDERLTHEGQVLGCNYASADVPAEQVLYVGGGKFHPLGLAMEHPDKHVVIADPVNNVVTVADTEKFMKQRYGAIHRAMDAEKWGVIFCTKIGQGRWETAEEILENNENAYLITMDEVTPDRLRNFDMDAFVNTGCPRITTDDGPQFHKPMLTPGEYRIAVGDDPLESLSFDTFHGTW